MTLSPTENNPLANFLRETLTDDGSLDRKGTPQNEALMAIQANFPALNPDDGPDVQEEITQMYALNTLYFSTSGSSWVDGTGWTGPTPTCEWPRVSCTGASVVQLDLSSNDLMGGLPSEIRGLTALGKYFTKALREIHDSNANNSASFVKQIRYPWQITKSPRIYQVE
jgi:hypothetical protein